MIAIARVAAIVLSGAVAYIVLLPWTAAAAPGTPSAAPTELTVVWGGDIHLGRAVADGMSRSGHSDPFDQIRPHLAAADLRVANLEGPLTAAPRAAYGYYLTGDPAHVDLLAAAGFDLLGLANNHATDNGGPGLDETTSVLRGAGVASVGAGPYSAAYAPVIAYHDGLRVAVLAFNYIVGATQATEDVSGVAEHDYGLVAASVANAARHADLVFVMPHWGVEYLPVANGHQRRFARDLVEAGADAVIGHHPHVVQDVEWLPREGRRPALVAYSLGNLIFDSLEPDAQLGALLWTNVDRHGVKAFRALPIRTDWLGAVPLERQADHDSLMKRLMPDPNTSSVTARDDAFTWFGPPTDQIVAMRLRRPPPTARRCVWLPGAATEPHPH